MKWRPEYNLAIAGFDFATGIWDCISGYTGFMVFMFVCVMLNIAWYIYTREIE